MLIKESIERGQEVHLNFCLGVRAVKEGVVVFLQSANKILWSAHFKHWKKGLILGKLWLKVQREKKKHEEPTLTVAPNNDLIQGKRWRAFALWHHIKVKVRCRDWFSKQGYTDTEKVLHNLRPTKMFTVKILCLLSLLCPSTKTLYFMATENLKKERKTGLWWLYFFVLTTSKIILII